MVSQGDIVTLDFNPQTGHEQAGYWSVLVVSNNFFNNKTNMAIVCPITNTNNEFPLHIKLDKRTATTGFILCEHVKSLDINQRHYKTIEKVPADILQKVIDILSAEIEIL